MATTASRMLEIARSQLGLGENPPGSNYTKYGAWYGLNGMAWCAMFMSWCANQAGALDIIPKHAYTPTGAKWFYDRGQWGTTPRVGALVYFAFYGSGYEGRWKGIHHVGIVESIRPDGRVVCIEGNVSDKVMRVVRAPSGIAGYGYPKYQAPTPPPPKEDTVYQWIDGFGSSFAKTKVEAAAKKLGIKLIVRAGDVNRAIYSVHTSVAKGDEFVKVLHAQGINDIRRYPGRDDNSVRRLNAPTSTTAEGELRSGAFVYPPKVGWTARS